MTGDKIVSLSTSYFTCRACRHAAGFGETRYHCGAPQKPAPPPPRAATDTGFRHRAAFITTGSKAPPRGRQRRRRRAPGNCLRDCNIGPRPTSSRAGNESWINQTRSHLFIFCRDVSPSVSVSLSLHFHLCICIPMFSIFPVSIPVSVCGSSMSFALHILHDTYTCLCVSL